MCNFLSGIATKEKIYIDWRLDSHTDIIEHFELEKLDRMNGKNEVGLVRWELTPDNPMTLDFDKWTFKTDQDIIPSWFDKAKTHKAAIDYLKSQKPVGDCKIFLGQALFQTGRIERLFGYVRFMLDSSRVGEMCDSSRVGVMYGSSQVGKMCASSQVGKMLDSSQVGVMYGSSQVGKMWASSQVGVMLDSSQVGVMLDS